MYGYIYLTTNLITGKKYIGKHRSATFDNNYLGSGKYLKNTISKYGRENFTCEVLEQCETLDDLNDCEIKWITQFNAVDDETFYNLAPGGEGHTATHSAETRKKMSECKIGKKQTEAHIQKLSEARKGKHRSEETRHKMSEAHKARLSKLSNAQ